MALGLKNGLTSQAEKQFMLYLQWTRETIAVQIDRGDDGVHLSQSHHDSLAWQVCCLHRILYAIT